MQEFKIGIMSDCFGLGMENGIRKAAQIGAQGIQLYALGEEFNPKLAPERKRGLKKIINGEGLSISALCAELGGFTIDKQDNSQKVDQIKEVMEFASEMGTNVVTAHAGIVPEDHFSAMWQELQHILGVLGEFGRKISVTFAIETGPEKASVLRSLLDTIEGVGVNFDPANLVMVAGDDPVLGVYTLRKYIVHTHAKDGIKLHSPLTRSANNTVESGELNDPMYIEVPLGTGSVNFSGWLQALQDIGYHGFLTIEREVGNNPIADILLAIKYLKEKMIEL